MILRFVLHGVRLHTVARSKLSVKYTAVATLCQDFAETAMNELLGWYGYENTREDLKISRTCRSQSGSNSSGLESPKSSDGCGWCGKLVEEATALTSASATFCSELCFSQSRRASFKRNKTCDWCRHVRHTVSYVDFQDGASQLQFCSDKCLNQYKMHIFCRETTAHLEMHPHLHGDESSSNNLITPDLWLKNCKSPELCTPLHSPKPIESQPQTTPLSLVTATYPSDLTDSTESKRNRLKSMKKSKKRISATVTCNNFNKSLPIDIPQDLRVRHTPTEFENKLPQIAPTRTIQKEPIESHFRPIDSLNEAKLPGLEQLYSPPFNVAPQPPSQFVRKTIDALLPPPTIFVPYPIILPLPIPIPILIPIPSMFKNEDKEEKRTNDVAQQTEVPEENITSHVEIDVVTVDEKEEPKKVGRLLRKRRRNCDPRNKVSLKNKKLTTPLST